MFYSEESMTYFYSFVYNISSLSNYLKIAPFREVLEEEKLKYILDEL